MLKHLSKDCSDWLLQEYQTAFPNDSLKINRYITSVSTEQDLPICRKGISQKQKEKKNLMEKSLHTGRMNTQNKLLHNSPSESAKKSKILFCTNTLLVLPPEKYTIHV